MVIHPSSWESITILPWEKLFPIAHLLVATRQQQRHAGSQRHLGEATSRSRSRANVSFLGPDLPFDKLTGETGEKRKQLLLKWEVALCFLVFAICSKKKKYMICEYHGWLSISSHQQ
jgi:hypothetical protein